MYARMLEKKSMPSAARNSHIPIVAARCEAWGCEEFTRITKEKAIHEAGTFA